MSRLRDGGLIDRTRPLNFSFDGRSLQGFAGDTLASALVANDIRLVGRSFKYHRPRGIVTAGSAEPNALVMIGAGAHADPNSRATTVELFDGLEARSQNRWPTLRWDLLAINQLFAPLLPAGFYYKMFMWPSSFWEKVYEPIIRRAAGLGRLSGRPDPANYDRDHAFCDLLVIGAGPAGLVAALTAARAGARVILADEDFLPGGRLLSETHEVSGQTGAGWALDIQAELAGLPNVTLLPRTSVFGVYDGCEYGALERLPDHPRADGQDRPRQRLWKIVARRSLLATGAIDRPIVFGGNDRPGVMMASAVSTYVNRHAAAPGKRALIFTSNDSGWATAQDLLANGVEIAAIVDTRTERPVGAQAFAARGIDIHSGAVVTDVRGRTTRQAIVRDEAGRLRRYACDMVAMTGGWTPVVGLASHLGARPVWNETRQGLRVVEAPPGMSVIGAANGNLSLPAALADGFRAGAQLARDLGFRSKAPGVPRTSADSSEGTPFWFVRGHAGKAFVDFQNDVTDADVGLAAREGFVSVEHMKRYTTLGMATDQGKLSQVNGAVLLAEATGAPVAAGTVLSRPPVVPVAIGAFAGHHRGVHFRPARHTPSHDWSRRRNAVFTDAGLWRRAQWYPLAGDRDWRETVDREVTLTRTGVGICDVSTLGKIDIQGPDAAVLLDRLYINLFSTLPVGKARYGIMLREDGFVFDDGTTTRFAEDRYFMTTTTANAARVMQHIDFALQVLWPELDAQASSVTEQWASFAVAGPNSRLLVQALAADVDLSNAAFPHMAAMEWRWGEVPTRIFRLSFSGELAFEVSVPTRHAAWLLAHLFELGEPLGAIPYGTEALGVMRIEKGHLGGAELNGQTTAGDLGFARMMSKKKDFIGRALASRPGLSDPTRPALIGLRPLDHRRQIAAGGHLIRPGATASAANSEGHITSAAWSPTLGHGIALGLLVRGPERHGEHILVCDPMRQATIEAEICSPVFVDPEGARVRG